MTSQKITIRSGLSWAGVAQLGKIFFQLVSIVILARLLPPSDYGLMAMAATVTAFANLFRDFGTGAALVQSQDIDKSLKQSVFYFNIFLGLLLSLALLIFSPLFSAFFNEPRLKNVLYALSPVFIATSFGIVQQSLLERNSLFKKIALIEILSSSIALIFALFIALKGGGVYALVVQSVSTAAITSSLLWISSEWRPKINFKNLSIKQIWKFSSNVFLFNFVNYFHRNADSFLIGRFLGPSDLGIYNVAYRILLFPLHTVTFVIARASFPIYSRNQDDLEGIGLHYLEMLKTIAFITAPLMGLIWTVREPFLHVVLGAKWMGAAEVMAWLVPVGFFQSMVSTSGSVLNAIGRSDILRNLGFVGVPFLVASIVIGLQWGIVGVAMAYCVANFLWVYPVVNTVLGKFSIKFRHFLFSIYRPVFLSLILAYIWYQLNLNTKLQYQPKILQIFTTFLGFSVCFIILSRKFWPKNIGYSFKKNSI